MDKGQHMISSGINLILEYLGKAPKEFNWNAL